MEAEFERELKESLYVHLPLDLYRERSLEAAFPHKRVTARQTVEGVPKAGGTASLGKTPGLSAYHSASAFRPLAPGRARGWGLLQLRHGAHELRPGS